MVVVAVLVQFRQRHSSAVPERATELKLNLAGDNLLLAGYTRLLFVKDWTLRKVSAERTNGNGHCSPLFSERAIALKCRVHQPATAEHTTPDT